MGSVKEGGNRQPAVNSQNDKIHVFKSVFSFVLSFFFSMNQMNADNIFMYIEFVVNC